MMESSRHRSLNLQLLSAVEKNAVGRAANLLERGADVNTQGGKWVVSVKCMSV